jgi:nucleolar protein 58
VTFEQLETRLQVLEKTEFGKSAGSAKGKPKIEAYEKDRKKGAGALITPAKISSVMVLFLEKYYERPQWLGQ